MKKLTYQIKINAAVSRVFKTMLDKETYKKWTSAFNPSSDFEGIWEEGEKINFIGINEHGEKEGMIAEIAQYIPNAFVSIRHLGILNKGQEILSGPAVEDWAGALENYSFFAVEGKTELKVDVDTNEDFIEYFNQVWPNALLRLKNLSEME
ncbi:SRPBCC domain-containing protein [uncultured Sphingobacterium sp.]|uniref:SRPBCC domain-containing protein n=1 Tax=uncultured Sphingobacterium sp. TaxID=182688 RepID=UPI0025FBB5C3|nr:SRPBCC domain-containing protein [uncultured Sphingobacterium sp.]